MFEIVIFRRSGCPGSQNKCSLTTCRITGRRAHKANFLVPRSCGEVSRTTRTKRLLGRTDCSLGRTKWAFSSYQNTRLSQISPMFSTSASHAQLEGSKNLFCITLEILLTVRAFKPAPPFHWLNVSDRQ